jgi:hypothetical protein
MRTFALSSLLLVSGLLGLAQDSTDKAPPAVEEALRARVDQYYHAFMAGKFKDAYLLVADDSQDAFMAAGKEQFKACETIKIGFSDNFTKATVVESCKGEWKWHGTSTPTTFPITSTWKIVDGQWFWFHVKATETPFPFSPSGFVPVPQADSAAGKNSAAVMPGDFNVAAQGILARVSLDKQSVHLPTDESSQDVIHIHNAMPGVIKLQVDQLAVHGLTIALGKTELAANQDTTLTFQYRLDDPEIACLDCAKKLRGTSTVALRVMPTGQTFSISIVFGLPIPAQVQHPAAAPK